LHRILILLSSILISFCLGGVYAWSAFVPALREEFGLTSAQCQTVFGVTIAVFTIAMVPAGRWLGRISPRWIAGTGGLTLGLGYLLASFGSGSFISLLLGVGVVGGIGIGLAYVCPIAVCLRWFPHHRGLITGLTVCGFGGGGIGLSWLIGSLQAAGVPTMHIFRWVGLLITLLVVPASLILVMPRHPSSTDNHGKSFPKNLSQILRSRAFAAPAVGMFSGTFAGLMVIGNLREIGLAANVAPEFAMLAISLFAVGNGTGRIIWGGMVDRWGKLCIPASLLVLAGAITLNAVSNGGAASFLIGSLICGFGFGACFVVYAAQISERFGVEQFASVYPLIFLLYGLSGILGPVVGGMVFDATNSFVPALMIAVAVAVTGALIAWRLDSRQCAVAIAKSLSATA